MTTPLPVTVTYGLRHAPGVGEYVINPYAPEDAVREFVAQMDARNAVLARNDRWQARGAAGGGLILLAALFAGLVRLGGVVLSMEPTAGFYWAAAVMALPGLALLAVRGQPRGVSRLVVDDTLARSWCHHVGGQPSHQQIDVARRCGFRSPAHRALWEHVNLHKKWWLLRVMLHRWQADPAKQDMVPISEVRLAEMEAALEGLLGVLDELAAELGVVDGVQEIAGGE